MSDTIADFVFNLKDYMQDLRKIAENLSTYQEIIKIIRSIPQKINDDITSLTNIKDHEIKKLEKEVEGIQYLIEEIKLIRYLSFGIKDQKLKIEFDEKQKQTYKDFKERMLEEAMVIEKSDFTKEKIASQYREMQKIYNLITTGKVDLTIDNKVLDKILDDFDFDNAERSEVKSYIVNINFNQGPKKR